MSILSVSRALFSTADSVPGMRGRFTKLESKGGMADDMAGPALTRYPWPEEQTSITGVCTMGSDMYGGKVEICCEVGKVTSVVTGMGRRTKDSGRRGGKFKAESLGKSRGRLDVTRETGGAAGDKDDKGGRGIDSSKVIGRCEDDTEY